MNASWKNVKRSGTFRRKVKKERDEMLKKAREFTEEQRKKGEKTKRLQMITLSRLASRAPEPAIVQLITPSGTNNNI